MGVAKIWMGVAVEPKDLRAGSPSRRGETRADPEPLFILAPARSYSTITVALLSGHPGIYGFPEMLLFYVLEDPTVGGLLRASERWWLPGRLTGVLRAVAEIKHGGQTSGDLQCAREWLENRRTWTMVEVMDDLLKSVAPRIGVEKSPDTVNSDARLGACLSAYPTARFLHLVRHPVDTQRSMYVHWRTKPSLARVDLHAWCANEWYNSHRRVTEALRQMPTEQWRRVRAEDLLREPVSALPEILDWLNLDGRDAAVSRMQDTSAWRFAGTGAERNLFGGDPKFLESPELRPIAAPAPVITPSDWGLSNELRLKIEDLAREYGYE